MDEDKSKIDQLRDILYSRKVKIKPNFVLDLKTHSSDVGSVWEKEKEESVPEDTEPVQSSLPKKIFWFTFVFFVLALGMAVYVYFNGGNVISSKNINIDIVGPTSVKAGEETTLDISVTNYNNVTLEVADLVLEYPKGTRSAADKVTPMVHDRVPFGNIGPNETVRKTIKSVLFGEEGKPAHIQMTLEYRIPSANSVFTKDASYDVMIGSIPLTLSVEALKEVNANQDYELRVNVVSNSSDAIHDVVVVGEFPVGFEPITFSPEPLPKTYTWDLGDIEATGKRVIIVKGKMYGDHNDERYFKFNVGTKDQNNVNEVNGIIATVMQPVSIKEPFLGLSLALGQAYKTEGFVAKSGAVIPGLINMINNLDVPIYDANIELSINGNLVLPETIKPSEGFYDSNTKSVRWNKFYNKDLENLSPKQKLSVNFLFTTDQETSLEALKTTNPEIVIDVSIRGNRRLESGVPEEVVSTLHKKVKVNSDAHLKTILVHSVGPIENEGLLPPQVGKKTEYTVTWTVTNNFNELGNAKVTTVLPDYVNWTNVVAGQGEKVNYNADSRMVTWDLGSVKTSQNGKVNTRQVSFQVSLIPSISQAQTAPIMVNVANFSARDTFTNTDILDETDVLTTDITNDPSYVYGDGSVKN